MADAGGVDGKHAVFGRPVGMRNSPTHPVSASPRNPIGPPAAGAAHFVDVTGAAHLHFRHVNGASGRCYYPETFGSGCVFFDYDGDGWQDIFLVNSAALPGFPKEPRPTCALYHNNRDGTFTDVTAASGLGVSLYGMGACAGDFDNDGHEDLFVTGLGESHLFHNNGNGTFTDVTARAGVGNKGHWGTSCAWLDYDNDGRLDLFVCNYVKYRLQDEVTCRTAEQRIYCGPLVYQADSCRLFHNEGGGRFRDVTRAAGIYKTTGKSLGVAVWDFDGNGYPDIIVANDLTPNYLFKNNRNGTFREIGADAGVAYGADGQARSGMGIDVADIQNNGRCAIFISNFAREPNSLFVQWPQPFLFSDHTYETGMGEASLLSLGFGLCFLDYDNSGWPGAFVANGHIQPLIAHYEPGQTYAQHPLLFRNRHDGTFEDVSSTSGPALQESLVGRGVAAGDFDNDGRIDLLVTCNNGPAALWKNETPADGHWVTLHLVGRKSNRDGIGAMVTLAAGKTQRQMVRSGSSYLSQSDLRLHFGLGHATHASVRIHWPSGKIDTLPGVPLDRISTIVEGSGRISR